MLTILLTILITLKIRLHVSEIKATNPKRNTENKKQ